ncbi:MAG: response regulator [Planctomycetaceae bacterium]|nr:response regulator [Planctomycetaceae bacterium]
MDHKETENAEHPAGRRWSIDDLQKQILEKESVLRAKGRLIDNMAYQIRTLSNAVIGFSDLLLIEQLTPELMEYVKEINQAGNGLSSLVNEVLDWARLESGRLQITKSKCNVSELVRQLESMMASVSSAKSLTYSVNFEMNVPAFIVTDTDRLLKCLTNLVINAVKNTAGGKFILRVATEQRSETLFIRFDLTDRGQALSAEQIKQLFEPAAQEEDASSEILSMMNMGLAVTAGLPLTRQLAQALGGTVEVSSRPGEGSTFSLLVPAGAGVETEKPAAAPQAVICQDQPAFDAERRRQKPCGSSVVLLVEDQPSNRTVISLMLESLGVQVDTAEDGKAGFEAARSNEYGLILMDLKMPRMDGYEAAKLIRQSGSQVPLIALSAKVLSEKENKEIDSLFDGFLSKPIDSQKLAETLKLYLPEKQEQQAAATREVMAESQK